MRLPSILKKNQGVGSVEIVVGVSIMALVLIIASETLVQFVNTGKEVTEKTQAIYFAEEGLELTRFMRDSNWLNISALTLGTTYGLALSTTTLTVTTTPQTEGVFTRTFIVTSVYRLPANDDIFASTTPGVVVDPNARYVTMNVTWGSPTSTVSLTTILTNLDL